MLEIEAISGKQRPYYCQRVEEFFACCSGGKVSAEALEEHLARLSRGGILGWQFMQAVSAIRLALCHAGRAVWGSWAGTVDWKSWTAMGRELEKNHPTRLRGEVRLEKWMKDKESWMKPHPAEAKGLGAIDQKMREKIREKAYAAKTEESYVSWVVRYGRLPRQQNLCD